MLQSKTCQITGSGATINVELGFEAGFITAYNEDGDATMLWSQKHGDALGFKRVAAGDGASIASLGITPYAGGKIVDSDGSLTGTAHVVVDADGTALTDGRYSKPGITIGADTDFNVDGEVIELYVVEREAKQRTATAAGYTDEG